MRNQVLARTPAASCDRLKTDGREVSFDRRSVLYHPEGKLHYLYFPYDCFVSIVTPLQDGAQVEIGVVGFEGAVGVLELMAGQRTTPNSVVAQRGGWALRVPFEAVQDEFDASADFRQSLLNYASLLTRLIGNTAVSNVMCTVEQRLARWLLMAFDRTADDDIDLTQEQLAQMLCARRSGVTLAASTLQNSRIISYKRGHIRLIDRAGLERVAGECYANHKQDFDRFLQLEKSPNHAIPERVCAGAGHGSTFV